jgi:hypothetical protein
MPDEILSKLMNKYAIAEALCNSGEYEEALLLFDKAIKEDPLNYVIYESKGDAYFNLEQYSKAITEYKKALELNPNRIFLKNLMNKAKKLLLSEIREVRNSKNYTKTLELAMPLIKLFPDDGEMFLITANIYLDLKQYSTAIDLLKECLSLKISKEYEINALINLTYSMYCLDMYEECIKLCIKINEKYDEITFDMHIAECYKALSDIPNMEKYFDIVAKKLSKMNDKELKENRSLLVNLIRQSIKLKNYSRQIMLSKIYINRISKHPDAMIDLAEAYKEIGKYKEAIRIFEKTADYYAKIDAGMYAKEQLEMCRKLKEGVK